VFFAPVEANPASSARFDVQMAQIHRLIIERLTRPVRFSADLFFDQAQ
jgi:hypothetical protein